MNSLNTIDWVSFAFGVLLLIYLIRIVKNTKLEEWPESPSEISVWLGALIFSMPFVFMIGSYKDYDGHNMVRLAIGLMAFLYILITVSFVIYRLACRRKK